MDKTSRMQLTKKDKNIIVQIIKLLSSEPKLAFQFSRRNCFVLELNDFFLSQQSAITKLKN